MRSDRRNKWTGIYYFISLGLSLAALSPAAAWYFIVVVGRFFALQGKKTTHIGLKIIDKRKS